MTDFFAPSLGLTDESFIRGAARLMWAAISQTFPTKIGDVVNMSTFQAMAGWNDLGATKDGIQITYANTEESFDVDQVFGDIDAQPTGWSMEVGTSLAEMTLDHMQIAWEGDPVSTTTEDGYSVKVFSAGTPNTYTKRKLAVLFPRPVNQKIRGFFFRKVQLIAQNSQFTFNKTGPQQTLPLRFRCLPDLSIAVAAQRYVQVRDQL